uniref:COMM domain containing 7 n=1 Tax=Fundulus heteroclitus TaxID=8078 RepID=A0A3Q2PMR5_FUNHE
MLHFAKDVLPDSVSADFQKLNKFNEQQYRRLIEILFQFLLDPKETDRFMRQLTEFAGEHGISAGPLRNLMKSVLLVPQGGRIKHFSTSCLCVDSSLTWMTPVTVGSSADFRGFRDESNEVQSCLTLAQFYNFLHEMERAKASMECFA